MAKYKCPTLGDCDRANAGEVFERAPGEDLKCPGCSTLLEAQAAPVMHSGKPKLLVPLVAAAVVVIGAGAYLFLNPQPQAEAPAEVVAQAEAPAAAPAQTEPAPQAHAGIAPSDAETAAQRRQGEQALVDGKAAEAEAASSQAAANEMLKTAIAKMAQGKLDEAEKELLAARSRAPKQPLVYYNMAVLRLKQARTDDALKEFEGAFLAGFSHFREMDADSDLDQLRKDPRFDKLVKQYRPAGA